MSGPIEIRPCTLAPPTTLAGDLLRRVDLVGRLLPGEALEAARTAEAISGRPAPAPRLPASAFRTSGGTAAQQRLERILAGGGALVSTGQQPILFLGPLFVLYKALSAIELARRIEASSGRPSLALFWVASDDHDWAEIGRTRLLDTENELREIRLEPAAGWEARSAGAAPLPRSVSARIDDFFELIPDTEFKTMYLDLFRDTWAPGRRVGEAFAGTLRAVLGDRPFAWLDAADPALKRASAPLYGRALREATEEENVLAAGAAAIGREGYEPPIPLFEQATNVFYDSGGGRERLYRDGERIRVGRGGEGRSLDTLLAELESAPERFSPNVALRPVLESWLLPVRAVVLGPGELAYWSQLPPLFEQHAVSMPVVVPRHGWLLLEGKVAKVLDKLEVEPKAFAAAGGSLERRLVRDSRPAEVERAIRDLRAAIGRGIDGVEKAVADHLPGLRSAVGKAGSHAFRAVGELEAQIDTRMRAKREVMLEQVRKAALHLYPDRRPQERIQSPLYYLGRYGPGLVDALAVRSSEDSPPLWPPR